MNKHFVFPLEFLSGYKHFKTNELMTANLCVNKVSITKTFILLNITLHRVKYD